MKFWNSILIASLILISSNLAFGQCDYKVEIDVNEVNDQGIIKIKVRNLDNFECVLFAYEGGNKIEVDKKEGSSDLITFNNLSVARYYKVVFTFSDQEELLCKSWASELINFNN